MKQLFKKIPTWYTLLSALSVLVLLLFIAYRDEGYNNWSWMQDAGSWIFLFIAWNVLFWFLVGIGFAVRTIARN